MTMKMRFLGGYDNVTGSCILLEDEERDFRCLVDCGMTQGEDADPRWNSGEKIPDPAGIGHLLITHAHQDHCGLLLRLVERGFAGKVYCTAPTERLVRLGLSDAAWVSEHKKVDEELDAITFVTLAEAGPLAPRELSSGVVVETYRSGHILGAASFRLRWTHGFEEGSITFSGDLGSAVPGRAHHPLLGAWHRPPASRYAVMESTYGDRARHADQKDGAARRAQLAGILDRAVIERRGTLIIPCFAIDRTQALLHDLATVISHDQGRYGRVPVFFDAPLAAKVSVVYGEHLGAEVNAVIGRTDGRGVPATCNAVRRIHTVLGSDGQFRHQAQRASLAEGSTRPAILVTGGGMCEGGRVTTYLERLLRDELTTVLFTGFLSRGTLGHDLSEIGLVPPDGRAVLEGTLSFEIRPNGGPGRTATMLRNEVRARIEMINGYSGHADQADLLAWYRGEGEEPAGQAADTVFLAHGNTAARNGLREALRRRSLETREPADITTPKRVELPSDRNRRFDLDLGDWDDVLPRGAVREGSAEHDSREPSLSRLAECPRCAICPHNPSTAWRCSWSAPLIR